MKKALFVVWCCQLLLFILLTVNIILNFRMSVHYRDGIYNESDVTVLGMIEPYKYYYNKGNIYYKEKKYEEAEKSYKKALKHHIPDGKECSVRINLALSMVTPLDLENINDDNRDDIIKTLEEARNILVEDDCAHMDDENGHSKDAQTLKDEIDELLDSLQTPPETENVTSPENETQENETRPQEETPDETEEEQTTESETSEQQTQEGETSESQTQEGQTSEEQSAEEQTTEDPMEEELRRKLQSLEQQGNEERQQNLDNLEEFGNFGGYDGNCW